MAIPTFDKNVSVHQSLPVSPSDTGAGGLTWQQLQAVWDSPAEYIKAFLNDELITALIAANIPFTPTAGLSSTNVGAAINETYAAIAEASGGTIVDGSVTWAKLATAAKAILSEAQAGTANDKIMTPLMVAAYVTYIIASTSDAQAGTSNAKLMTPAMVQAFITYIMATQAEAEGGVNTTKLMNPLRVRQAISKNYSPKETDTATWNESIAASGSVTKTISHSIGAIPSKVKIILHNGVTTTEIEATYSGSTYNFTMNGRSQTTTGTINPATWKTSMVASGYILGQYVSEPTIYMGTVALGNYKLILTNITFSSSAVTFSITNSDSGSALTLASSVIMEVYE